MKKTLMTAAFIALTSGTAWSADLCIDVKAKPRPPLDLSPVREWCVARKLSSEPGILTGSPTKP